MEYNRSLNILCWNVRGLNDPDKWDLVYNKIEESACSIFYFQETKKESCDLAFLHKFAPKRFDCFEFCPSEGASGGIIVGWMSRMFTCVTIDIQIFAIRLEITSTHDHSSWHLITVYGPTREPDRTNFVAWLYSIDIAEDDLYLLLGTSISIDETQIETKLGVILITCLFSMISFISWG